MMYRVTMVGDHGDLTLCFADLDLACSCGMAGIQTTEITPHQCPHPLPFKESKFGAVWTLDGSNSNSHTKTPQRTAEMNSCHSTAQIYCLQGGVSGLGLPRAVRDPRRRPLHRHDRGFLRRDRVGIRGDALAHAGGRVPQAVPLPV